jgi:hypothetical protein
MHNKEEVQCSNCGKWVKLSESVHNYCVDKCYFTCHECAPAGRTVPPDAVKGGRELLENLSILFEIMSDTVNKNPELKKMLDERLKSKR